MSKRKKNCPPPYALALSLVTNLKKGDEYLFKDILASFLFSSKFLNDSAENLNQIKLEYIDSEYLFTQRSLTRSVELNFWNNQRHGQSLLVLFQSVRNTNKFLTTPDWIYLPIIIETGKHETSRKKIVNESTPSSQTIFGLVKMPKIYLSG